MTSAINSIWLDIVAERLRQEHLCAQGKFRVTLATPTEHGGLSAAEALTVCAEEFGEVSEIVADSLNHQGKGLDREHLREELIQLAACCVAWVEQLDGATPSYLTLPYRDTLRPSTAPAGAGVAQ